MQVAIILTLALAAMVNGQEINFSPVDYTVNESSGYLTLTLVASSQVPQPYVVIVITQDQDAFNGTDYIGRRFPITFPSNVTEVSFNITLIDDTEPPKEDREEFFVIFDELPSGALDGETAAVTILDDCTNECLDGEIRDESNCECTCTRVCQNGGTLDQSTCMCSCPTGFTGVDCGSLSIEFERAYYPVTEGDSTVVNVVLSNQYTATFLVRVVPERMGDINFNGFLQFTPPLTSRSIRVDALADDVAEEMENITLSIDLSIPETQSFGIVLGSQSTTVIGVESTEVIVVTFASTLYSVVEGQTAEIQLNSSIPAETEYTIQVVQVDGHEDFEVLNDGIATYTPGSQVTAVQIRALTDEIQEPDEVFTIEARLTDSSTSLGVEIGGDSQAADVVVMDMTAVTFVVQLYLRPVSDCLTWVESNSDVKLSEISEALSVSVQLLCNCFLSVQRHFFSCLDTTDSHTVVFLAELSYIAHPSVDMPSLLTFWVTSTPHIIVTSTQLQVDPTCPVVIDSLKPKRCPVTTVAPPANPPTNSSTAPPTDLPTDVTVIAAVCAGVLVVIIITVAIVIAGVVLCRKHSKYRSKHVLPNPVYEYEYMGSASGGVALANMTRNPSYVTAKQVLTNFATDNTEEDKVDHTYEVLPFEANEGGQEDPTHGSQHAAADSVHV